MSISSSRRTRLRSLALPSIVALVAGCSGAGSPSRAPHVASSSMQRASGTMQIGVPATTANANVRFARGSRSPDYVSTETRHAALFIDGSATAAGSTTSCTSASCAISWAATINVPGTHTFAVEVDDNGTHTVPLGNAANVLAEGSGPYAIVAGSGNSLGTLNLNGVALNMTLYPGTCASNSCSADISLDDADLFPITYSGASYTTPGEGQTPTSGQVFDNDGGGADPVLVQADSTLGRVTGSTDSPYSTYNADQSVLTIKGVGSGGYPITVACASGVTGTFGIKISGGASPSGDVTSAELSGLSPAVSYAPNSSVGPDGDYFPNEFTCTSGQISAPGAASGSLPVN